MQMIELECPQCQTLLELDAGFAGGVCRCSNCGTLMTVPADPQREKAESLSRPERPDAPGASSGGSSGSRSGAASAVRSEAPTPPLPAEINTSAGDDAAAALAAAAGPAPASKPADSGKPGAPVKPPVRAGTRASAAPGRSDSGAMSGVQTFITASGKVIKVNLSKAVPTARVRKKVARTGVYVAFAAIVALALIGVVIAAIALTGSGETPRDTGDAKQQVIGYDPLANPFFLGRPNFLGIPLQERVVIAIDASHFTNRWLGLLTDALCIGLVQPGSQQAQVIFSTEFGARAYPEEPTAVGQISPGGLRQFLDDIRPAGMTIPIPAFESALSASPRQIILVTGQEVTADQVERLGELMGERQDVRFDVVAIDIGGAPETVESLVRGHQGVLVNMPSARLRQWFAELPADYKVPGTEEAGTSPSAPATPPPPGFGEPATQPATEPAAAAGSQPPSTAPAP